MSKIVKQDLRKPFFKNGDLLTAKMLNDLYKKIIKLERKLSYAKSR